MSTPHEPATAGAHVDELSTPVLIVDFEAVKRNLARAAAHVDGGGAPLRPHVKTHKAVELARLQVASGAIGVTAATVWEAAQMATGGIESILIANEVVGSAKISAAAETAGLTDLIVAIDDLGNARDLNDAAAATGTTIGFLVDVDVGMGRCGVRSSAEAVALAENAASLSNLSFRGLMGYEGHCVQIPEPSARRARALEALAILDEAVDAVRSRGLAVDVVSSGGTGTFDITGTHEGITEIQIGSYVFQDTSYARIVPMFEISLTVLATVISRHLEVVVLDCGSKTISAEHAPPALRDHSGTFRYLAEEHAVFEVDTSCELSVGDRLHVQSGHACATTNLHNAHHVVVDDAVTEVWPIVARGPG